MSSISTTVNGRNFAIEREFTPSPGGHVMFLKAVTYRVDGAVVSPIDFEGSLVAALVAENRPHAEACALARQIVMESGA